MENVDLNTGAEAVSGFLGFSAFGTGTLVVVAVAAAWVIKTYNGLVTKKKRTEEAWATIDTELKKRFDLIPNLVETVKGYAAHEKEALEAVITARSKAGSVNIDVSKVTGEQMAAFGANQSGLSGALGKLFALAEAYPDLKANENFKELQTELVNIEEKINAARRFFNGVVLEYNTAVSLFPANILASMFQFNEEAFWKLDEDDEAKEAVEVDFKDMSEKR